MFISFLDALRKAGFKASLKEHLMLLEALDREVIAADPTQFYFLARATYVSDEKMLDRFDQVFAATFKGVTRAEDELAPVELPEEWLKAVAERFLTPEEKAAIEALGDWDEIMETLKQRLAEQQERHEGGSKWIGTGGTSPFGHSGYNPAGVRIGGPGRHGRAVKIWEKRLFRDLDGDVALGTRNIQVALKRLRRFAREGAAEELDLERTIEGTARQGWLDVKMRPERHNAVKLLLFLDIGGSMDPHVRQVEELFSAARSEFKHLEHYYFHNCIYEGVWKENRRRWDDQTPTLDIIHKFGPDHKLVIVGDASMSPFEITHPGGAIEHYNEEAGATWIERLTDQYRSAVWLNPTPEAYWNHSHSTRILKELMDDRMYPLTLDGLDAAMRELSRKH
ncbi:vWA domain-containing protein [Sphingomicrobium astaxanthinifaciens]|uniref:vWA domain-containing protein n=1 Tax=Sphingomicrobium astaxanthinifaciens TaxID=1227949 RepID=UPI001FCAEB97|nr:VWA domain-containing protein [Sphingomicrobium astaxanthinifaciens]MCJ7422315.1 VWA domain-containing protein [Sphingomicrobium astaxanthinifaciens]